MPYRAFRSCRWCGQIRSRIHPANRCTRSSLRQKIRRRQPSWSLPDGGGGLPVWQDRFHIFRITAEPDISQVCASVHTALEDLEGFKDMAWHGTETQLVRSFPTCKMAYEDRIHGMHLWRLGELLACIWPKRIDDPDGFSKPAGWSSGTGWSCSRHLCRLR